jgi:hypothetical protein
LNVLRVPWSGPSFLAYLGGFTVLFGAASFLGVQADERGAAGLTLWAALASGVVLAFALFARRTGHPVTAGLLAFVFVVAVGVFFGALFDWFGWLPEDMDSAFGGFRLSLLALELLVTAAAVAALLVFRFSLLVFAVAASGWFFTTDLLSNGGNWSAILSIGLGVAFLVAALAVDAGEERPAAFWLHVVSGLTIGGGLLWFFHESDLDWILVALAGLCYIALGDRLARSSWIVLGAWGLLQFGTHFAEKWSTFVEFLFFFPLFYLFPFLAFGFDGEFGEPDPHPWVGPLIFAALGAIFFALALLLARRRAGRTPGAELI